MPKYPTKWSYGLPRGSIIDRKTNFLLNFAGRGNPQSFTYKVADFESREECKKHAEKMKIEKSREFGFTRNEIRFIDANTIEIKLTQNKTFITDAENIEIVGKYPLQAKANKEKDKTRYYVLAQDCKKAFKFTDLLNNYKIVEYINGNTLDLRKCNMREFGLGFKAADNIVNNNNIDDEYVMENHAVNYLVGPEHLPKNEWILGSIPGTIFYRSGNEGKILTVVIKDSTGKARTKTFDVSNYDSENDAKFEATIFLINVAHKLGVVKNKIRINDDYLEIMIEEDLIMKTDLVFLPLFITTFDKFVSDISICKTRSSKGNKIYAAIYLKDTDEVLNYHKFIMGHPMIDHINGDPLDNRLINLRYTTYKHNNNNKLSKTNLAYGVRHGNDQNGDYYVTHIHDNNVTYSKMFYVNDYGNSAKKLAAVFRKGILEINFKTGNLADIHFDKTDLPTIENSIERTLDYRKLLKTKIIESPTNYLHQCTDIDPVKRKIMHNIYLINQIEQHAMLTVRIAKLKKIRDSIIGKNMRIKNRHEYAEV